MSVAFEIEVAPSRVVALLHASTWALPAAGALLAAVQCAWGPTWLLPQTGSIRLLLATALLAAAAVLARRAWLDLRAASVPFPGRVLAVCEAGEPAVAVVPGRPPEPSRLRASCRLPGLILLVLSPSGSGSGGWSGASTVTLLSGRDGLPDEDWRRLNVWLRWMERGRHTLPSS
jgi:hypothetical protein